MASVGQHVKKYNNLLLASVTNIGSRLEEERRTGRYSGIFGRCFSRNVFVAEDAPPRVESRQNIVEVDVGEIEGRTLKHRGCGQ